MTHSTLRVLVATVLLAGLPSPSVAATEIQFWHAMTAAMGERVNDLAAKFNASQSDYVVKAVHKGSYAETYRGVAQFFEYVGSTENQAWWAGVTGYLPLTNAAAKAMEASGHYAKIPNQKTAVDQMNNGKTTPNSQGIRLGNFISVRDAIEEQMENIFSGNKTPRQGLDDAVAKGNEILKEFAALYK